MHAKNIQTGCLKLGDCRIRYQKITRYVLLINNCTECPTHIIHPQPEVFKTLSPTERAAWRMRKILDLELAMGLIT
jgi:hypothetical protein